MILDSVNKHASRWIYLLITAFLIYHFNSIYQRSLNMEWNGLSLGLYSHTLWNIAQGNIVSSMTQLSVLKLHGSFILFVLAPLYKLISQPELLLVVQTLFFGLGCWVVYQISLRYLSPAFSLFFSILYCFYLPWSWMHSGTFHPLTLAMPFLGLAIIGCLNKNLSLYAGAMLLSLSCDVRVVPLIIIMIFHSLIRKRELKWTLASLFIVLWALIIIGFIGIRFFKFETSSLFILTIAPYFFWFLARLLKGVFGDVKNRVLLKMLTCILLMVILIVFNVFGSQLAKGSTTPSSHLPMRKDVIRWLFQKIPVNSSVLASSLFLPHLSNRDKLHVFEDIGIDLETKSRIGLQKDMQSDYALVDFGALVIQDNQMLFRENNAHANIIERLRSFFAKTWYPMENVGSIVLFSSTSNEKVADLFKVVDLAQDSPYLIVNATANDELNLLGFTMNSDDQNIDIVRFRFYWQKLRESNATYGMFFNIMTPEGDVVHTIKKPLCFNLYPFEDWSVGDTVLEKYSFVIPERLLHSTYEVHFGVYDVVHNKLHSLKSPREDAIDSWGMLKLIALDRFG